jgi:hypothetical protein
MLKEIALYNNKVKISFDEDKHIFYDEKGKVLLSVTGATGVVDKSGALMGWAVKMALNFLRDKWLGKTETPVITEEDFIEASRQHRIKKQEAADIGTLIHEWVSLKITGKNPEMPKDDKVVNGITAFLKFQKEHNLNWIESERYVYSKKHGYAGILDAIAEEDGKLTLVDFKSSNGIYDDMFFQVAGYQIAYEEETEKKIERKLILRFGKEDGEFEVKELDNSNKDKKAFLACLELKRRLNELK